MSKNMKNIVIEPSNEVLAGRITAERALREAKEEAVEKERQTQHIEYARRLADLNHAHELALEVQSRTVSREMFDAYVKERNEKVNTAIDVINDKLNIYARENVNKVELALNSVNERNIALITRIEEKHDADIKAIAREVQIERETRKAFEGSINTWRYIATTLASMGILGVLALFLTR